MTKSSFFFNYYAFPAICATPHKQPLDHGLFEASNIRKFIRKAEKLIMRAREKVGPAIALL